MKSIFWNRLLLSALLSIWCTTGAWAHADLFSSDTLDQAKQKAKSEGKLLLVDFTASWCPPCKKMESSTWTDSAVKDWIRENAIAIQVDVDKDKKTTEALNVDAMPTLVLFNPQKGSSAVGRHTGYMSASELLPWLQAARGGNSGQELAKKKLNEGEIWTRISQVRQLQEAGENAEALAEYVWLWTNIGNSGSNLAMVRVSMLPHGMKTLSAKYPPAQSKFSELRDTAEKANNRRDWIILNGVLSDSERTLSWFDKIKNEPGQRHTIEKNTALLERVLFNKSRWKDAADYLYPEPLKKLQEYYKRAEDMKKPRAHTQVAKDFDPFPPMVILLYCAYLGAGRDAEAQKIANECLRLNDTPAMRRTLSNSEKNMRQARKTPAN